MWNTLQHRRRQCGPLKFLKCPIEEVPDLARPASGRRLDPVTSRSPLQTTFFCDPPVWWGCRAYCWRRLFPACLGLFRCPLRAIDKCRNNGELAAGQDAAVPQIWGGYPVTPEKSLSLAKQGRTPARREAGGPPVLTLYTAQSRRCLSPLWPSQAASAKCCWSLTNGTLPSAA